MTGERAQLTDDSATDLRYTLSAQSADAGMLASCGSVRSLGCAG